MSTGPDPHLQPAQPWFAFKRKLGRRPVLGLGILIWVLFFSLWQAASSFGLVSELLMPPPGQVLGKLIGLLTDTVFLNDIVDSVVRIVVSFSAACAIAIPLGILMGTFHVFESFFNPFVSAWRYLPAPSFIPILLMWFGTGEGPKLALLFIGVVFFLITIIMDHAKQVRTELIETALTLGANRRQVLRTVVVPAVLPNVVVAMRQMLAVSWTYLVIAEIVASTTGIGAMMMRARRFLHTDEIMSGIIVIGFLGLLFDMLFRLLHRWWFDYLAENA